jgi:hypothetical protein
MNTFPFGSILAKVEQKDKTKKKFLSWEFMQVLFMPGGLVLTTK